jgi:hypothetical protein
MSIIAQKIVNCSYITLMQNFFNRLHYQTKVTAALFHVSFVSWYADVVISGWFKRKLILWNVLISQHNYQIFHCLRLLIFTKGNDKMN